MLQLKAVHDENTALVLQLQTVNKEKKVLEVDNSALNSNIVELKSRLRTNRVMYRDTIDVVIITFLGSVLGLLLDPVSLARWLRGEM